MQITIKPMTTGAAIADANDSPRASDVDISVKIKRAAATAIARQASPVQNIPRIVTVHTDSRSGMNFLSTSAAFSWFSPVSQKPFKCRNGLFF